MSLFSYCIMPFGLDKIMEIGKTKLFFFKRRTKSAHLPQSSRALLLVNVNEVAYHSSLKGAALSLHPYLEIKD